MTSTLTQVVSAPQGLPHSLVYRRPSRNPSCGCNEPPQPILFNNAVYYHNTSVYRNKPPSCLDPAVITHLYYGFALVGAEGNLELGDAIADDQMAVDGEVGCIRACTQLKGRNPRLKVLLSCGDDSSRNRHLPKLIADPARRRAFAESAAALIEQYGLDGLDIDWESRMDVLHSSQFALLLEETRHRLESRGHILSVTLPAADARLEMIDVQAVARQVDLINLMTFDFFGPDSPLTGHQSQLYPALDHYHNITTATSCLSAVDYLWHQDIPARKIMLGVPVYGRSFLGATQISQTFTGAGGANGIFPYDELPRPGAVEEEENGESGAVYCVGGDGGFVSYDNPTSVGMKAEFVMQNKLAGIFFRDGASDHQDQRSLIMAGHLGLHQH